MRSILRSIRAPQPNGKPGAPWLWLAVSAALCGLSGCGGGVRNTARNFSTVVVDAGHGGHDAGTRSSQLILEKTAALDVAQRLDAALRGRGFRTVVTRPTDNFITLDRRVLISNRTRGAIFVSVHFNEALARRDISGAETYYFSPVAKGLAQKIESKVGALPGGNNRGVKTARFRVLRKNKNPAVLVECGYLSNGGEAARISSPGYREAIAQAIAAGVAEQRGR